MRDALAKESIRQNIHVHTFKKNYDIWQYTPELIYAEKGDNIEADESGWLSSIHYLKKHNQFIHVFIDCNDHSQIALKIFESIQPFQIVQILKLPKEHYTGSVYVEAMRKSNEDGGFDSKNNFDDILDFLEDEEEDENLFMLVFFTEN